MTLDPSTTTPGARFMLPVFVAVNVGYGLALLLDPTVPQVPAYRTLDAILVIPAWAGLFIATGLAQALALVIHRRETYIHSLGINAVLGAAFTGAVTYGAIQGTNPWTALWLPLFYTCGCFAIAMTLEARSR